MNLKGLIWDVDGTMVDSEEIHRAAFNRAFEDFGLKWYWARAVYASLLRVAGGRERLRHFLDGAGNSLTGEASIDSLVASLHARKTVIYNHLLKTRPVELRPGVLRLLRQARDRGVLLAIATTSSRENVRTLLDRTLAEDAIPWAAVVTGEDVASKKPSADAYRLALVRLGLAPGHCLALEDSRNGVRAACAAGLRTVAIVNDYTEDHDLRQAFVVLSTFGDSSRPCVVLQGQVGVPGQIELEHLSAWLDA